MLTLVKGQDLFYYQIFTVLALKPLYWTVDIDLVE